MIIMIMGSANERRRYIVTSFLIRWIHTQNDPRIHLSNSADSVFDDAEILLRSRRGALLMKGIAHRIRLFHLVRKYKKNSMKLHGNTM